MIDLLTVVRWLHVLAGAAWLGEVVVINFVLVPLLTKMELPERGAFIASLFPRLFRLASVLALLTLSAGLLMSYLMTGWQALGGLIATRWGLFILVGGSLGLLLALFHFFVESRLTPMASSLDKSSQEADVERVTRFLQVVPRLGLVVILASFILMMLAARGH